MQFPPSLSQPFRVTKCVQGPPKKNVLGIGISYKMLQSYPPYKKGETDIYIKSLYWRKPRASFPAFVAC